VGKLIVEFTCECGTRCRVTFRPPTNNLSEIPRVPLLQHCAKGKPQSYANILTFEELYEAEWMEVSPLHERDKLRANGAWLSGRLHRVHHWGVSRNASEKSGTVVDLPVCSPCFECQAFAFRRLRAFLVRTCFGSTTPCLANKLTHCGMIIGLLRNTHPSAWKKSICGEIVIAFCSSGT